jgi:hypothetical protein
MLQGFAAKNSAHYGSLQPYTHAISSMQASRLCTHLLLHNGTHTRTHTHTHTHTYTHNSAHNVAQLTAEGSFFIIALLQPETVVLAGLPCVVRSRRSANGRASQSIAVCYTHIAVHSHTAKACVRIYTQTHTLSHITAQAHARQVTHAAMNMRNVAVYQFGL